MNKKTIENNLYNSRFSKKNKFESNLINFLIINIINKKIKIKMDNNLFGLTQEERNAQQLYNYIGVANNIKHMSLNVYFFLKNYAFNKAINMKLPQSENKKINDLMNLFYNELRSTGWDSRRMSLNEYNSFLEYFYSTMDFNTIDLNNLFLCKDLLEVIPLDDLGKQRMEYFNKKIEKFKTEDNDKYENKNNNNQSQKDNKNQQKNENSNNNKNINININQNNNTKNININPNDNNDNYQNLKNIDILDMNKVFGFQINNNQNKNNEIVNNEQHFININENKFDNEIKNQSNEKKEVNIENKLDIEMKNVNQFPKLVKTELINNPNIKNQDSKEYENVKSEIINNLKLSSTEMDYHNIAMAKDHFEAIVYYLRELLGKNK